MPLAQRSTAWEKAAARPQTLMYLATIGAKTLKKRGLLPKLGESEEVNACSIRMDAEASGETACTIEGIPSPDGRVGKHLYRNVPGNYDIGLFRSAVKYYK